MGFSARLALIAAGLCFPGGCVESASNAPPEIHYGSDVCAVCGMIISDERYAGALLVEDAEGTKTLLFDDVGEMIAHEATPLGLDIRNRWVKDADTRVWLKASDAWLVRSESIHTPMGTGVAAFASRAEADAKGEEALRYDRMVERERSGD